MQLTLGRATGVIFTRDQRKRGFLLMIRGWTFNYVHFLDSNIGISWSRALDIGKRRWWFTEDWQLWAKKDKHGVMYVLGGRARKQRAATMLASGYTQAEVTDALDVSQEGRAKN